MTSSRTRRAVLAVVLAVAVLSGVTPASAQDHAQEPAPPQLVDGHVLEQVDDQNATESNASGEGSTEVVRQVDEDVRVLSYRYDAEAETFFVTLENTGDYSSRVTITEVLTQDRAQGDGSFGISVLNVAPGETVTAKVSVKRVGLDAVMILTEKSIESGQGTFLAADSGGPLFQGDATWGDVRAGVFAAMIAVGSILFLGGWQYVATKNTDVEDVEVVS